MDKIRNMDKNSGIFEQIEQIFNNGNRNDSFYNNIRTRSIDEKS